MSHPIRPLCFVAMPFGSKSDPYESGRSIAFDRVYEAICRGVEAAGFECRRADGEQEGGFVHKPMYEALLVAECVVADVTFGNSNVAYELGVRHGAGIGATVLICEQKDLQRLSFDVRPLRVLPYAVDASGAPADPAALADALRDRILAATREGAPTDNPIAQVTRLAATRSVAHEKADVFLGRLEAASAFGARIRAVLRGRAADAAAQLRAIEDDVRGTAPVRQLHSALLSVFLGYREVKAYDEMVRLYKELPRELRETPVAREQLALALNRLAEGAAKGGRPDDARVLRGQALEALEAIAPQHRTSETLGIEGRIYKGQMTTERDPLRAAAARDRAIQAYEEGLRLDPRDYFPGVNAITLRLERNDDDDRRVLPSLQAVVRFAVERTPEPTDAQERYWRTATLLELAAGQGDWTAAQSALRALLVLDVPPWMHETTADNLRIVERCRAGDASAVAHVRELVQRLLPDAGSASTP